MKRRNFLKGLVATPAVIAGCKAITFPANEPVKPNTVSGLEPGDIIKQTPYSDIIIEWSKKEIRVDAGGHNFNDVYEYMKRYR